VQYPSKLIEDCVNGFARFPGIGKKTALRLTLHLLKQETSEVLRFSDSIKALKEGIKSCTKCFNLSDDDQCGICTHPGRDQTTICVVADMRDLLALESAGVYRGLYHVLGGLIAPMEGVGPEQLHIHELVDRINEIDKKVEIILALPSTLEGDTTAFYLSGKLKGLNIQLTAISRGISVGSELEYADELSLARSLSHRTPYNLG
jgi:recombination protein RecR